MPGRRTGAPDVMVPPEIHHPSADTVNVTFGLLGPFVMQVQGRPVPVRSPKHRTLLAALLLGDGRVVPVRDLVDAMWDGREPDSPRRAVQLTVVRLRALLDAADCAGVITTSADGYRIELPTESLDLNRFRRCLDDADRAADRPDPAAEAAALRRALSLWRGEPLADVPSKALLTARLGAARVDAEPDAVNGIVDMCGGLPLALAIVAARGVACPTLPLASLYRQLQAANIDLDRFSSTDVRADVRTVLSWSYRALGPQAAQLFRVLGRHPSPVIREAAAASLAGAGSAGVRLRLDELIAAHLVGEPEAGSFVMHHLIHAYAAELARALDRSRQRVPARYGLPDRLVRCGRGFLALGDGRR